MQCTYNYDLKVSTVYHLKRQFTALSSELCVFWPNGCGYNHAVFKLHCRESIWRSSIVADSHASILKVTSRFGIICSQLLRLVTQIYGNKRSVITRSRPIRTTERWYADPQNVYWLSSALSTNILRCL